VIERTDFNTFRRTVIELLTDASTVRCRNLHGVLHAVSYDTRKSQNTKNVSMFEGCIDRLGDV